MQPSPIYPGLGPVVHTFVTPSISSNWIESNYSVIMEPSSPKKIQFAVPPLQGQIDPQAAEHIRRRRPTPATLQIYRQPGTDVGDQQNASGEPQASDAAQRKQSTYAPPSMKGKLERAVPEEEEEESSHQG
ncbi:hypothetical protein ATANTOWER_002371 [Ataeniobius toweri]|uniref:Protein phosphatase 1 regulatory subunit 1C n=1 Tax=Ataeniobius toweri TaxID=208326 RepID=A0ABU7BX22_9TELE|nr:hypothetical protein [Ataeniobius toweri]